MKREKNRLSPVEIRSANTPGLYNDGFGLNLQVSQFWSVEYKDDKGKTRGRSFEKEDLALAHQTELRNRGAEPQIKPYVTKSWLFRFMRNGKDRKMGLGPFETTSLAKARELAKKKRDLLRQGIDPIAQAQSEVAANKVDAARALTSSNAPTPTSRRTSRAGRTPSTPHNGTPRSRRRAAARASIRLQRPFSMICPSPQSILRSSSGRWRRSGTRRRSRRVAFAGASKTS